MSAPPATDEARAEIERLQKDVDRLYALLEDCANHLETTDDKRPVLLANIFKALEQIR
jgi:phosphate uptake regulator